MRRALALLMLPALLGATPAPMTQAERLRAAKTAAEDARARSARLEAQARDERDAVRRAALDEAAVQARIAAGEEEIRAATARVAIVDRLLEAQRARLAERQAPMLRLVAALQSFARRPAAAGLLQPGPLADAVHVRAMLGTITPVIARRTAEVREEIARVAALQRDARLAAQSLQQGRARLQGERIALARLQAEHRLRSAKLTQGALFESDRAIALGERARGIIDLMAEEGADADTRERLATLAGPLPRPASRTEARSRFANAPYRLPAAGEVVTGFGETGADGVRARGVTLATWAGAAVVAPAAGRVVFARPFRRYGQTVIIDHGQGWTSALTGLGGVAVRAGQTVAAGAPIGRAADGESPRLTIELRRRGVPMDLTALL